MNNSDVIVIMNIKNNDIEILYRGLNSCCNPWIYTFLRLGENIFAIW